jgi:hypothetical protein
MVGWHCCFWTGGKEAQHGRECLEEHSCSSHGREAHTGMYSCGHACMRGVGGRERKRRRGRGKEGERD